MPGSHCVNDSTLPCLTSCGRAYERLVGLLSRTMFLFISPNLSSTLRNWFLLPLTKTPPYDFFGRNKYENALFFGFYSIIFRFSQYFRARIYNWGIWVVM